MEKIKAYLCFFHCLPVMLIITVSLKANDLHDEVLPWLWWRFLKLQKTYCTAEVFLFAMHWFVLYLRIFTIFNLPYRYRDPPFPPVYPFPPFFPTIFPYSITVASSFSNSYKFNNVLCYVH